MWIIYAFIGATLAGVTAILSKIGVKDVNSTLATAIRTIVVLIMSFIIVLLVGSLRTISSINNKTLLFLILSGLSTGASWLCYFKALQMTNVNKVTPIDKSSTILTMILAFIFLKEEITLIKVVCIVLIAVGTYLMIEKKDLKIKTESKNGWLIWALLSALFASLTSILGKVGIEGIESNLGTTIRTVVVLFASWLLVFITKKQSGIKNINKRSWLFLILSGIATGGSWLCFYNALKLGPASIVVPIDKLSIVVTILFSYLILKEKLNKKSILGLILIVIGTLLLLV